MEPNYEYESRSRAEAMRHETEINRAPLSERKEAQENFLKAMKSDPALVGERIGWLIDGNYGYGEMLRAKQVVASPRMNREAALTQLVAVYEWQCPAVMAVAAWKKLSGAEKKELSRVVEIVIEAAEREAREG